MLLRAVRNILSLKEVSDAFICPPTAGSVSPSHQPFSSQMSPSFIVSVAGTLQNQPASCEKA